MVSACSGRPGKRFKIDAGAERDDELVIVEIDGDAARALDDDHLLLLEVDAHDLGLTHLEPAQQLAQRHDRIGGMDAGRGDLGQQRLEDEIVVGVDELDLELAAARAAPAPWRRIRRRSRRRSPALSF